MMSERTPNRTMARASRQSRIRSFGIRGLYGYRSIQLDSKYAATILIAQNGSGKTTLLGALDAFLNLQFSRLRNLEFSEIFCSLQDIEEPLVLSHEEVIEFLQVPTDGELVRFASRANIDINKLFSFLTNEIKLSRVSVHEFASHEVMRSIIVSVNYNYDEAKSVCEKLSFSLFERIPNILRIRDAIRWSLKGHEVVYLPTYRRIELSLTDDDQSPGHRRKNRPRFSVATGSLFPGDIQFGLSDIADRLNEMNMEIISKSNIGYRNISADIIQDLLDGSFESSIEEEHTLPTEDELKLFFSRLEQGDRIGFRFGPVPIPDLQKIYTQGAPGVSNRFLRYFLGQLSKVINTSNEIEAPVDSFVRNCNKYLGETDLSVNYGNNPDRAFATGKELRLDRHTLRVQVRTKLEDRKISLDALSSGEKQMISLFAKLYLYPNRKIVLIDEPELSLSLDWQRAILVDVLNAPLCDQIIAITHSPFVFDNELEPFAKSIAVAADRTSAATLFDYENDFDIDS